MAKTNRHEHFISQLDTELDKITGLYVLDVFNLDTWTGYEFPYAHVELSPETLELPYESYYREFKGNQEFVIWVGVEDDNGDNLRNAYGSLVLSIEKQFSNFTMSNLETSDFTLHISSVKLTGIYPVLSSGETKYIFLISGNIHYTITWK